MMSSTNSWLVAFAAVGGIGAASYRSRQDRREHQEGSRGWAYVAAKVEVALIKLNKGWTHAVAGYMIQ